mgnify:CR=1 FL=1
MTGSLGRGIFEAMPRRRCPSFARLWCALALSSFVFGAASAEEGGAAGSVERGLESAGEATQSGLERAGTATGRAFRRAIEATGEGIGTAIDQTGRGLRAAGDALSGSSAAPSHQGGTLHESDLPAESDGAVAPPKPAPAAGGEAATE